MKILRRLAPDCVEWLLVGAAAAMFLTGAILRMSSPEWWGWYLRLLDPWYWSFRGWIIAAAVLVEIIVVIRFWAKHRRPAEPSRIEDIGKRVAAIGILLVAILCVAESTIPITWSELPWYWRHIDWYWTNHWWVKVGVIALFTAMLSLLLWIRSRLQRRARKGERSTVEGTSGTVP